MDLSLHLLLFVVFLGRFCRASYRDSICDEPNSNIFCTCNTKYKDTSVVCYITHQVHRHDDIWRSLAKVHNLVQLKLNPMSQDFKLDYIPTESLRRMESLDTFILQQASLGTLRSMAVSDMKTLRELELEGNDITNLEKHSIFNLPELKKLSLSENLLQEVLADSLKGVDALEQLFLDRNNISRIEGCAFCNLHSLRDLELFGNRISDLTEYMFIGLRYLKRLDLYKNQIRILNDRVFHSMPKLVELDLSDNEISHVSSRAFLGLEKLQKLMLHSNKIKVLPDLVFKSLPTLRNVDLYYNELETLQKEVLENMANLREEHFVVAFKENPLKCDCKLHWVKTYLQMNKSRHFSKELQELQCRTEDSNSTLQTVHSMSMDCTSTPSPMTKSGHISSVEKSTSGHVSSTEKQSSGHMQSSSLIPYGVQSRRSNRTSLTTVLADEITEVQDSEAMVDQEEDMVDVGGNGPSGTVVGDAWIVAFASLMTVFVVRRRKGTL